MNVDLRKPSQLTPAERHAWVALRAGETGLDNPFFAIEFFELLDAVRGGVEIALLHVDGRPLGFLPIERRGVCAQPAGQRISEIHGPIASHDLAWNPVEILSQLNVSRWQYRCAPAQLSALVPYHHCQRRFPGIDLAQGFTAYRNGRRAAGSHYFEQFERKSRKMVRECGPLRFVWHASDDDALHRLMDWKSSQYRRSGTLDLFRFDWVREFARQVQQTSSNRFEGVLSALYCADEIVAVHLGLRSNDVLCWWVPAYDPGLARFSPGAILSLRIIEAAAEQGITRIDLGQGTERYKQSLANTSFEVAEGAVDRRTWNRAMGRSWIYLREWAQSTPACAQPLRLFRSVRNRFLD